MHSPEDFVRIFMVEGLGVRTVVLGEDALFGRANAGTIDTMRELGRRYDFEVITVADLGPEDRKSTRLNSSHVAISYAVFCLKKKKQKAHTEWAYHTRGTHIQPQ